LIVAAPVDRHNPLSAGPIAMKLFLPSARATNYLLLVGFCSLGYALYIRYLAIEQSTVGLACAAGPDTWLCFVRRSAIALFENTVFGWAALIVAALNLLRPSLALFAVALALGCFGVVLYNTGLSALAFGLLLLSFGRRAPEAD
jgi:hypothetical protein